MGLALAGRTAQRLQEETGIGSITIQQLRLELERGWQLPLSSVLVVDEAAMVGTRDLAWLGDEAQKARAKLVLVGDDQQLPEIDAGGGFRGLTARLGAAELTVNRRQAEHWERHALDLIRDGRGGAALAMYKEREAVVEAKTAGLLRDRILKDWLDARDRGEDVRIVARRRCEVADLNQRARALLRDRGEVHGPDLEVNEGLFAVGDEIVTRRNNRSLGVTNGTMGRVVQINQTSAELRMQTPDGRELCLPPAYVAGRREWDRVPHVMHAYATTAHLAQGATFDRALVLAGEEITKEWGYVALSRGRKGSRLYAIDDAGRQEDALEQPHGTQHAPDSVQQVARGLERSEAKTMALVDSARGSPQQADHASRKERQLAWLRHGASHAGKTAGGRDQESDCLRDRIRDREL